MNCMNCTVIGGGVMGRQIGMNAAISGHTVMVYEAVTVVREDLRLWAVDYLSDRIAKERMTAEQAEAVKARFLVVDDLEYACAEADIVIEAIVEDQAAKAELLASVSHLVRADTLIVTNSSFMVSSLFAPMVLHPERLANLHYFAPALVMKLVEVVKGEHTAQTTVDQLIEFSQSIGKTPVLVQREEDGFIVNNILKVIKEEAYRLVSSGVCTLEDLDAAVELGLGHPMGPFKIDDMNGLDTRYHVLKRRLEETGIKSYGYEMIEEMYRQGRYGKKSKHGFYDYE